MLIVRMQPAPELPVVSAHTHTHTRMMSRFSSFHGSRIGGFKDAESSRLRAGQAATQWGSPLIEAVCPLHNENTAMYAAAANRHLAHVHGRIAQGDRHLSARMAAIAAWQEQEHWGRGTAASVGFETIRGRYAVPALDIDSVVQAQPDHVNRLVDDRLLRLRSRGHGCCGLTDRIESLEIVVFRQRCTVR